MPIPQRLRSLIKSKVAIGVLSLLYVVCMVHLFYLSMAVAVVYDGKRFGVDKQSDGFVGTYGVLG